jgi:hypothetical protein
MTREKISTLGGIITKKRGDITPPSSLTKVFIPLGRG